MVVKLTIFTLLVSMKTILLHLDKILLLCRHRRLRKMAGHKKSGPCFPSNWTS